MTLLQNTGIGCQRVRMNAWRECLINNPTMKNFLANRKSGLKDKSYDKLIVNLQKLQMNNDRKLQNIPS